MKLSTTQKSFTEVIKGASPYTPGKALDTLATSGGDTILTPAAVSTFDLGGMTIAEQDFRDFFLSAETGSSTREQAQAAIIRQRLAESR